MFEPNFSQITNTDTYSGPYKTFMIELFCENSQRLIYQQTSQIFDRYCVKSVLIRSFFSPYFSTFGLNTERYGVQSECVKIRTGKTSNMDTFHAVRVLNRGAARTPANVLSGELCNNNQRFLAVNYCCEALHLKVAGTPLVLNTPLHSARSPAVD